MSQPAQVIALDVGEVRTGLARASVIAKIAEPLAVVPTEQVPAKLKELMAEQTLEALVVGRPRNMSGQETAQSDWTRDWAEQLKKDLDVPIYWQDETLTSHLAERPGERGHADAAAAALILQDFLDSPKSEKLKL